MHLEAIDNVIDTLVIGLVWPDTVAGGGHPWIGDLAATITFTPDSGGPSLSIDLFRRVGASSADSLGDSSDIRGTYLFSNFIGSFPPRSIWDEAASVGFNQAVPGGAFPPSTRNAAFQYQPLNFAVVFGRSTGPGTWAVNVSDHNPGNSGRLLEWTIDYLIPTPSSGVVIGAAGISAIRRRRH